VTPDQEQVRDALSAVPVRAATVARLDALDAAGWARTGRHATYGVLDVTALLRIALDHDEEHLAQVGRS
jgi:hypothetical protein